MIKTKALTERLRAVNLSRSFDLRLALIVALIIVSTGHVGRLFADREHDQQAFVGYVLAVAVDGVLAVSLADIARFRERLHKRFSLAVFAVTCAVSAGFNTAYYRQNYPGDPWLLSFGLGSVAPILAALVAVMREFAQAEREEAGQIERESERESDQAFRLKKYQIAQEAKSQIALEQERTKQAEERTKQEQARARTAQASVKSNDQRTVSGNGHKRSFGEFERAVMSGELSLEMSGSQIGEWACVSASTGRRWRKNAREGIPE